MIRMSQRPLYRERIEIRYDDGHYALERDTHTGELFPYVNHSRVPGDPWWDDLGPGSSPVVLHGMVLALSRQMAAGRNLRAVS